MKNQPLQGGTVADKGAAKRQPVRRKRGYCFKHKDVNSGVRSFADGINLYKLIWVFIIGCVIGVAWETFYCYLREGYYMRRSGMLYGPFNQVYGLGALLFTLLLYRFRRRSLSFVFLTSAAAGLVFEYVSSWVQELVFGSVSWEYSNMPFNIGGRTNLLYGLGWGLMGLVYIKLLWPLISEMVERIPNTFGRQLTVTIALFLAVNLTLSGLAVYRESQRRQGVPAANAVERWLDKTYPNDVMDKKYPSMDFVNRLAADKAMPQNGGVKPKWLSASRRASQTNGVPGTPHSGRWTQLNCPAPTHSRAAALF